MSPTSLGLFLIIDFITMAKIKAVITGIGGYLPDYILNNDELSRMVDTSDEWIMSRVGIKERHILKDPNLGTSFLGANAVKNLFEKKGIKPEEIEVILCATSTPDNIFPSTASKIAEAVGIKNAFAFDIQAACSGFLVGLNIATCFIESGRYKKVLVVAAEKMSFMVDYTDRQTCPLFGDGAAAALIEPTTEEGVGVVDCLLHTDGIGYSHLHMKSGGSVSPASHETVDKHQHFIYQEGAAVFKHAVSDMSQVCADILERNHLTGDDIDWLVPHQANLRIIDAVVKRTGIKEDHVMINIDHVGNTSAASVPLCLWEFESKLKKGDKLILTAFGAGFIWGAVYLQWGY